MSNHVPSLQEVFSEIRDFRNPQGKRYKLQAVLVLSCLAMMHGAQSEQAIAEWSGNQGRKWLRLLGFRRLRGPSRATIHRIFRGIDRTQLRAALSRWSHAEMEGTTHSEPTIDGRIQTNRDDLGSQVEGRMGDDDSLSALNRWVEAIMNQLSSQDQRVDDDESRSLFESLALDGRGADPEGSILPGASTPQHISEAGLKIWTVDYELLNSCQGPLVEQPHQPGEPIEMNGGRTAIPGDDSYQIPQLTGNQNQNTQTQVNVC